MKESIILHMAHLMYGGFVIPVLDFISERMGTDATGGYRSSPFEF